MVYVMSERDSSCLVGSRTARFGSFRTIRSVCCKVSNESLERPDAKELFEGSRFARESLYNNKAPESDMFRLHCLSPYLTDVCNDLMSLNALFSGLFCFDSSRFSSSKRHSSSLADSQKLEATMLACEAEKHMLNAYRASITSTNICLTLRFE